MPVFVVGKRTQANCDKLIDKLNEVTDEHIPFFTSDEMPHYENSLLRTYGISERVVREPGKRGRHRKPKLLPPPQLKYAQVRKHRRKGRVTSVTTKVIFGNEDEVQRLLDSSRVSNHINTSFIERNGLTLRQGNRRLTRKTNGFSKEKTKLKLQLHLFLAYYHLVRPHAGLRIEVSEQRCRWKHRTPAMAAGISDHIWSMDELLNCWIPPLSSSI